MPCVAMRDGLILGSKGFCPHAERSPISPPRARKALAMTAYFSGEAPAGRMRAGASRKGGIKKKETRGGLFSDASCAIRYFGAPGALGAPGAPGAPGALGAPGAPGAPGAEATAGSFSPQEGHDSASAGQVAPHFGQFRSSETAAGLKHIRASFLNNVPSPGGPGSSTLWTLA